MGVFAVALNGCGPVPKPFKTPAELGPPELAQRDINVGVWVRIVDAPPARGPKLLSEAVAQGLVARGILAMTKDGEFLRYKLTGRVAELTADNSGVTNVKIY